MATDKKIWRCEEECYRHYYSQQNISVRNAALIVNGYDPRDGARAYSNRNIDSNYRSIKRQFNCSSAYDLINTKEFFLWAKDKWDDFGNALPIELIEYHITASLRGPMISIEAVSLPEDPDELRKIAIKLQTENIQKDNKIAICENEKAQLSVGANKWNKHRKNQSEKAKKPRERN